MACELAGQSTRDYRERTCRQCGLVLDDPGRFHPYMFCVLVRGGRADPWRDLRDVTAMLGVELPKHPPLVRELKGRGDG